jgi:phosphoheptose isomerase
MLERAFGPEQCRAIIAAAEAILNVFANGGRVLVCGNGGSAADAQHIAAELVGRFAIASRSPLPAMALTVDSSVLTSIANDMGFEQVFSRQVEAYVKDRDILWAISTSGCSPNILAAANTAKAIGAKVLAFVGQEDCPLGQISDICLATGPGPTCHIQEMHQIAYHIVCDLIDSSLAETDNGLAMKR